MEGSISSLICKAYGKECNPLSLSMSQGLIRVAATRIFNVPEQSFLEIISNAIDATSNEKIGKFGMGFYSILYWVYQDSYASIKIRTQNYEIVIINSSGGPRYTIASIPPVKGTTVTINASFNSNEFDNQVSRFNYNKNAVVDQYIDDGQDTYVVSQGEGTSTVTVEARGRMVTIQDNGPGMDINTIMHSLLIPSVSTKSRPVMEYNHEPFIDTKTGGYFNIVVGGVVVYRSRTVNFKESNFGVSFPASTPLPIGRDDVMFTRDVRMSMSKQLMKLASIYIEKGDVTNFILQLTNYGLYTIQRDGKKIVNKIISYIETYPNIVPIQRDSDLYHFCVKIEGIKLVQFPSDKSLINVTSFRTENALDKHLSALALKDEVFDLKRVVHHDGPTINLSKYIITNTKKKNWVRNLISTNNASTLKLYTGSSLDLTDTVMNTVFTTTSGCKVDNRVIDSIGKLLNMVKIVLSHREVNNFLISLNDILAKIKYNFAYGSSEQIVMNDGATQNNIITFPKENEYTAYDYHTNECMYFFLETIETNVTGSHVWFPNFWGFLMLDMKSDTESFRRHMINGLSMCITPAEKLVFYYIMRSNAVVTKAGISEFLVNEIQRFGGNSLTNMVISNFRMYVMGNDLITSVINPVEQSLRLYTQNFKPVLTTIYPTELPSVTANQLINYIYSQDKIPSLKTILDDALGASNQTPLQTVSIAVNDGTTKSYGSAVISELVQNSIDASNSTDPSLPINIDIGEDGFSVGDNVGIKDIIYLLIPFLSSKDSTDKKVTGEMGTGFFNVYRECKVVVISTSYEGIGTYIEAYPIMYQERVVDIMYRYHTSNTGTPNHTKISVHLLDDPNKKIKALTDVYIYLKNYIAYTPFRIFINGVESSKKKTMVHSNEIGQIYYTEEPNIPSSVTTNDIPFTDFKTFVQGYTGFDQRFVRYCSLRIIININKEYYTPTQSRTKISTKDDLLFTKFLNQGIHLAILELYSIREFSNLNEVIQNTTSKSEISQLRINESDPSLFIENYVNPLIGGTISSVINRIIKTETRNNDPLTSSITDVWLTNKTIKTEEKKEDVVMGYLKVKKEIPFGSFPGDDKPREKKNGVYGVEKLQNIVDKYWAILNRSSSWSGKLPTDKPPKVYFKVGKKNRGYYNPQSHTIILYEIDTTGEQVMDILTKFEASYIVDPNQTTYLMRTDPIYSSLFSPCIPATTLLHELLHAVMSNDHTVAHGNPNFTVDGVYHTFDGTAVALYILAVNEGLYN